MKKLGIGIFGAGTILDAYAPALAANEDRCSVRAVCVSSRDKSSERVHAKLGSGVAVLDRWDEMLARDDIDAVIINLPHNLHLPATLAAAQAKKHVLCEKVMARNIDECGRMLQACEDAGVTLVIGHDRRYFPEWKALRDLINTGKLGRILYFKLEHNQNVIFPKGSWVFRRDGIGGGAIMSCLTHQIDALRWMGGEVGTVASMSATLPERMEGECIGVIAARMASGALAHLSINWFTTSNRTDNGLWYELIHVCGTEGEAYFMSDRGAFFKVHDESDKRLFEYALEPTKKAFEKIEVGETRSPHTIMVTEWLKMLRGEPADIRTWGSDSMKTVEVAEAAYRSEASGCFVSLPIESRPWGK